jgi:hypothetical protein
MSFFIDISVRRVGTWDYQTNLVVDLRGNRGSNRPKHVTKKLTLQCLGQIHRRRHLGSTPWFLTNRRLLVLCMLPVHLLLHGTLLLQSASKWPPGRQFTYGSAGSQVTVTRAESGQLDHIMMSNGSTTMISYSLGTSTHTCTRRTKHKQLGASARRGHWLA